MKTIAFLLLLSFLVIACEKEEKLPPNPVWLNTMISQLEASQIPGIVIYAYRWNGEYYYHVFNPISSCMYCDMYNYAGARVAWTDDEFLDFTSNGKKIKAVWEKGFKSAYVFSKITNINKANKGTLPVKSASLRIQAGLLPSFYCNPSGVSRKSKA